MRLPVFVRGISGILVLFLLAFSVIPVSGSEADWPDNDNPVVPDLQGEPYGSLARHHLTVLTDTIGARPAGSDQEKEAAAYIFSSLTDSGYDVRKQPFSFIDEDGEKGYSDNIIAVKGGESPQEIIVGAHYDSYGDGTGADDNAGSVAVLLEVAERLQDYQTPYTIRFVAFGAEEEDLDGSRYYVRQINQSLRRDILGMINLDGLIAGDFVYLYGDSGVPIRDHLVSVADEEQFEVETIPSEDLDYEDGTPCECADYAPFQTAGIPFVFFEATNWDLGDEDGLTQVSYTYGEDGVIGHTRFDTIEYLDSTFPGRIDQRLEGFSRLLVAALS